MASSSGGVFASLAESVVDHGGVVFGCAWKEEEEVLCPIHIMVDQKSKLKKLQGSKYVQSSTDTVYKHVKKILEDNRKVLFSGTPCQVAGLYGYLGKEYANLYTVDIICHGTPSAQFFHDYLKLLQRRYRAKEIKDFSFRDKTNGWGLWGRITYITKKGRSRSKLIPVRLSSYYQLFLQSEIYRENCYSCQYAGEERVGDITLGDFWGVQREHPEYLVKNGGIFDDEKGISCILVNSQKGSSLLEEFSSELLKQESTLYKVARENGQLKAPSQHSSVRNEVMELYKNGGYASVEQWYCKKLGFRRYIYALWHKLPNSIKHRIRKVKRAVGFS